MAAMLTGALPLDVYAQLPNDSLPAPRVSILICDPGSDIYELEGHAALRLDYSDYGGRDYAVNWGLFDFNAPNFVYRFVKGETNYMAGAIPTERFLASYARDGRAVRQYDIDLTPEQARAVAEAVEINLRPENRVYRYNYVLDNCATRPLAIVENALGSRLPLKPHAVFGENPTFREAMRYYHANYPWYQFGIDLALGSGIDRTEEPRAMVFAPVALGDMLEEAGIHGREIVVPTVPGGPEGPTPLPLRPLTVCWTLFALTLFLTVCDIRRGRIGVWSRTFDTVLYTAYGLAGLLVFFLVFISVHEATSPNWVALWLNPFALLVPALTWLKKAKKMLNSYQIANFGALIALLILWSAGVQHLNAAFLPLILMDMLRAGAYLKLNR